MESVLLAYSGGTDSTFLLKVARQVLKDKVVAVTAASETYPAGEVRAARKNAREIGVKYLQIHTDELSNRNFAANSPKRCYYCKKELFAKLIKLSRRYHLKHVACGMNSDDLNDFRPGTKALTELGIRSPLEESGLSKSEIRQLSKRMRLSTWDKPAFPCLSTRFPYGTRITKGALSRVERAERLLAALGLKQFRVRVHADLARIEVLKQDIPLMVNEALSGKIIKGLKALGYVYVALDLQGYRMGSMNEPLKIKHG